MRATNVFRPFVRPFQRLIDGKARSEILSITNWYPIIEYSPEDVFIVGYPKSGHTWFQNLVVGIVYGLAPEYIPDTLVQEIVPDVHYKHYYKRYGTPMFFKSHHLPQPEYKRVVYLLRDGRDVMVSLYHHNAALTKEEVDFMGLVQGGGDMGGWHKHVEAWLSNPYGAEMLIVKYEDLQQGERELARFCAFVGIERDKALLEKVYEGASFAKMRLKEVQSGWDDPRWPKDKPFVRRGQIGSYKDEMPQEILEAFMSVAGETLHKCGYR
jgi:hypothetical protein